MPHPGMDGQPRTLTWHEHDHIQIVQVFRTPPAPQSSTTYIHIQTLNWTPDSMDASRDISICPSACRYPTTTTPDLEVNKLTLRARGRILNAGEARRGRSWLFPGWLAKNATLPEDTLDGCGLRGLGTGGSNHAT